MGRSIDYNVAKEILEQEFQKAEEQYLKGLTIRDYPIDIRIIF